MPPINVLRDLTVEYQKSTSSPFVSRPGYEFFKSKLSRCTYDFLIPDELWPEIVDYFMSHDYNVMYLNINVTINIPSVAVYLLKKAYQDLKCHERLRERISRSLLESQVNLSYIFILNECNVLWDLIQVHKLTSADVACLPPAPPTLAQQVAALTQRIQELETQVETLQYAPGGVVANAAQIHFESTLAARQSTDPDALDAGD